MATVTRQSWAQSLLQALNFPVSTQNLQTIVAWEIGEGGAGPQFNIAGNTANYNPLNTTQPAAGASTVNSAGVKSYTSWQEGLQATVQTLQNGNYGSILQMLKSGNVDPGTAAATINASVWGTKDLTAQLVASAPVTNAGGVIIAGGQVGGSVAGLNGTGSTGNVTPVSLWTVGDPSNPDQDYWTTFNQYCMAAQWYGFSDGETLYAADGTQLMSQTPAAVIARTDRAVLRAEVTYDNTAFQYASTHTKKARVIRKTTLARLVSPTMVLLRIICPIDKFRAGDTVQLAADFAPANGVWLLGDVTRSIYQPYSDLTLVQAMAPINAATGLAAGPNFLTGKQASQPGSGTIMTLMLSEAATINNDVYPYVPGGGEKQAGTPDSGHAGGTTVGFDDTGAVAAVLQAGGLVSGSASNLIQTLLKNKVLVPGEGTGRPELTIFAKPDGSMFMRLNGVDWGITDGRGHFASQGQSGPGWIYNGVGGGGGYTAYHVPIRITGQQQAAQPGTAPAGQYVNPFQQVNGLVPERIDDGVDYSMLVGSPILAIGNVTVVQIRQWGGAAGTQPIMTMKFLDGSHAGQYYYIAEQITPAAIFNYTGATITPNMNVSAGTVICNYAPSGTGIETGWAASSGDGTTLAQANGHSGEVPSPEGTDFSNFLISLGAPGGT